MSLSTRTSAFGKLIALPSTHRLLVCEAAVCLLIGRVLASVPISRWSRHIGELRKETALEEDPARVEQAKLIGGIVRAVAEYVPWRSDCLPQALAARLMLGRRKIPSTLYLGVMKVSENGETRLKAHAWLRCGTITLTGGKTSRRFGVVSTFARWYV
jgi:hypothetical protein